MRLTPRRCLFAAAGLAVAPFSVFASTAAMTTAAQNFLAALAPAQRTRAVLALDGPAREKWFFVPLQRDGLPLKDMTAPQQELARALLRTGLSARGATRAETIITLENILREIEHDPVRRDPELYYVTIFGAPTAPAPWGWRFEGHHLSLNFTVFDAEHIAVTPSFFGTNPAEVRAGPRQGTRVLAEEEDLGLALVNSLDATQLAAALIPGPAPTEILTGNRPRVDPLAPAGLPATALTPPQRAQLLALLRLYVTRYPAESAEPAFTAATNDLAALHFAWAGARDRSAGHYYRIQGATFVIEFDNTQNHANHIHTVWRNFAGDFGRDLLAAHYAREHTAQP